MDPELLQKLQEIDALIPLELMFIGVLTFMALTCMFDISISLRTRWCPQCEGKAEAACQKPHWNWGAAWRSFWHKGCERTGDAATNVRDERRPA